MTKQPDKETIALLESIRAVAKGLRNGEITVRDATIMLFVLTEIPQEKRFHHRD